VTSETPQPKPSARSRTPTPAPREPRSSSSCPTQPLTGISRPDLQQLTERLALRQLAQAERLSYQRRGGPRQSGTRSGIFHQKLSNREHVFLATLYQRRLCTMDVLADLLEVCRSSIGNATRETRPLLEQAAHTSTPPPTRDRTATELLALVTPPTAPANTGPSTR
jgi:hypothetical protein